MTTVSAILPQKFFSLEDMSVRSLNTSTKLASHSFGRCSLKGSENVSWIWKLYACPDKRHFSTIPAIHESKTQRILSRLNEVRFTEEGECRNCWHFCHGPRISFDRKETVQIKGSKDTRQRMSASSSIFDSIKYSIPRIFAPVIFHSLSAPSLRSSSCHRGGTRRGNGTRWSNGVHGEREWWLNFFFFTFHPSFTVMFHKQSRGMPSFSDSVFLSTTSSLLMIACTPLTSLTQSSGSGGTPASITILHSLYISVSDIYSRATFHFPWIECDPLIYEVERELVESRWGERALFRYEASSVGEGGKKREKEKKGGEEKRGGKKRRLWNNQKKKKRREKSAGPLFKR